MLLLSGKIGAAECQGATSKGLITYIKHFALNEQETNRSSVATWSNEQAMREIYFEPFEISIKEGNGNGIMASMNRICYRYTMADYALLTSLLRNEWGYVTTHSPGCTAWRTPFTVRSDGRKFARENRTT